MHKYAHFSEDRREVVITRPDTPAPWVNYLSNGRYNGLISHTAGGFSFFKSPRDSRITRWRYNSLPIDRPGRYVVLRNKENGQYWSPTWQPTMRDLLEYECRHGLYYTRISSLYDDIEASLLYFVPADDDLEIWQVTLKNISPQKKYLDIFAYDELALGHALVDLINQPNDQHFNDVHFDRENEILLASKRYWVTYSGATVKQANQEWDKYVFFASSLPVTGWDGSKELFIGRWRSEANPEAVETGPLLQQRNHRRRRHGRAPVRAFSRSRRRKNLRADDGRGAARRSCGGSRGGRQQVPQCPERGRMHMNALRREWDDYLSHVQVETPDDEMNTMLNVWNQYQTSVTFKFSRDAPITTADSCSAAAIATPARMSSAR